jgi:hypothetical protein
MYQMEINIRYGIKIDQMSIKFTNNFHYKTLQNLPKLVFLVLKYTIWQPCSVLSQNMSTTFWFRPDDGVAQWQHLHRRNRRSAVRIPPGIQFFRTFNNATLLCVTWIEWSKSPKNNLLSVHNFLHTYTLNWYLHQKNFSIITQDTYLGQKS